MFTWTLFAYVSPNKPRKCSVEHFPICSPKPTKFMFRFDHLPSCGCIYMLVIFCIISIYYWWAPSGICKFHAFVKWYVSVSHDKSPGFLKIQFQQLFNCIVQPNILQKMIWWHLELFPLLLIWCFLYTNSKCLYPFQVLFAEYICAWNMFVRFLNNF